jgi:twitching motility protein PilU
VKLYRENIITYKDALKHADSANEVRLMIKLGTVDGKSLVDEVDVGGISLLDQDD